MAEVVTLRGYARRTGLSFDWLRSQVRAGLIPHLRAGRTVLLNPVAVTEALARMAAQPPRAEAVAGVR